MLAQHLGQGANQSFKDVDLLVELLEKYNPAAESPQTRVLKTVFSELEKVRLQLTADLVKKARAQGDTRVVSGVEECIKRNNWYRDICNDPAKLKTRFGV